VTTPDDTPWLDKRELGSWVRLAAVLELLPAALDAQLRREAELTHFEYYCLAMLSEAPRRRLRMTELALVTNATLPRLSHVVRRLEERGFVEREPNATDSRATDARLTPAGWRKIQAAAPGHVLFVRKHVVDPLGPRRLEQLRDACDQLLEALDPDERMVQMFTRYDD
jgi:DNA-binding MarR family transcriptional regulator